MPTGIGPAFASEITVAGLGDGISWSVKGFSDTVWYDDTIVYGADLATLNAVIAAHDSENPAPESDDNQKRAAAVAYAAYLDGLSDAVRKQQTSTPEFQTFLDDIQYLGEEGF